VGAVGAVGRVHERLPPARRRCLQQRRSGGRPVELVTEGDVPGIAAADGGGERSPGRLTFGKDQSLGVGDSEDGDPLIGATMLVVDDRVDAPVGDATGRVEPLLTLPRATRAVGDVAANCPPSSVSAAGTAGATAAASRNGHTTGPGCSGRDQPSGSDATRASTAVSMRPASSNSSQPSRSGSGTGIRYSKLTESR
jgi:hypothetical protein